MTILADAQGLLTDPMIASALGAFLTVAVLKRMFNMLFHASSGGSAMPDDYDYGEADPPSYMSDEDIAYLNSQSSWTDAQWEDYHSNLFTDDPHDFDWDAYTNEMESSQAEYYLSTGKTREDFQ